MEKHVPTPEQIQIERDRIRVILAREWPAVDPGPLTALWKKDRDQALLDLDRLNNGEYLSIAKHEIPY